MSKNLIYLCNNRLGDLDGVLPILMEVKIRYPETNILIVFHSDKHRDEIKRNHDLWGAIQLLKPDLYAIRTKNKFATSLRLIKFLSRLSFGYNIILRQIDVLPCHNFTMRILRKISKKVTEIKTYLSVQSVELAKNVHTQSLLIRNKMGKPKKSNIFRGDYDYFLSSLSPAQFREFGDIEVPEHKMIKSGYTHKLPEWQKYTRKIVKENKTIKSGEYLLYILAYTEKRSNGLDEPEMMELLEESLSVLRKHNNKIKTVLKPHAKTDMERVKKLLRNIGYSNYVIDYSHPFVLSAKAKFLIGNVYSCTMFDAYYQGKPSVEYCQYDPELSRRLNGQSLGGSRYCDFFIHRDKKQLEEVLDKLINGEVRVNRDSAIMRESFPDTPPEFYEFWRKQLS